MTLVERIRNRLNDAPMPTEHLLDEAADEIESLLVALQFYTCGYGWPASPAQCFGTGDVMNDRKDAEITLAEVDANLRTAGSLMRDMADCLTDLTARIAALEARLPPNDGR